MDAKLIDELEKQMMEVPFGNSQFQIRNFVMDKKNPSRAYRQALLELNGKFQALRSFQILQRKLKIDALEIEEKLDKATKYDKMRLEVDLDEINYKLRSHEKMVHDCFIEIQTYLECLKDLPRVTREEFEKLESSYWVNRLQNQVLLEARTGAVNPETIKTLNQIGVDIAKNEKNELFFTTKETPMLCEGDDK